MSSRDTLVHRTVALIIAGASTGVCLHTAPALAQGTGAGSQESATVVVTGSRIPRTDAESAIPLQVIAREEIERTGQQNVAEVIRSISADNQGSIPTAFTAGFAAGSSAISLRGLGVNSTLVLVNGRRMATYGLADDGSRTFVDLNSIPLEAVERVEVLKDGASALYGSDAIAGVVNVILRTNFEGITLGGNIGTAGEYDGNVTRLNATYGVGDLASDRYNFFVTVEGSKQDEIWQRDRLDSLGGYNLSSRGYFDSRRGALAAGLGMFADGSGPAFSATTPYGTVRTPGGTQSDRINLTACPEVSATTGVCLFDLIDFEQVQPKQERANVFSRGAFNINENMQAYAEFGWFSSKVEAVGTPGGVNDTGVFNPADPFNPLTPPHTTVLPASHPDNPTGINRTVSLLTTDLGGRNETDESDVTRVVLGLQGDFSGWAYDVGGGYIESKVDRTVTGFVRWAELQAAINDGRYRINNPALVDPATRAAISPALSNESESSVALIDGHLTRELMDLPGGPLGVAVGAEYRKEKTNSPPLPLTDTGEIVGLGFSAFSSDRNVKAGYVEFLAPVHDMLELTAALRYDDYSDFGDTTNPKLGFKFTPFPQVALRGTYAEGFRAPGPTESGNSSTLGFTNIAIISIGDPNVQPETSKSYTLGIVAEPLQGLSATIDYFKIDRENEIQPADQGLIVGGLPIVGTPNSRIAGAIPNSFLYYDVNGDLATISGPFTNSPETSTDGIDFDLRQRFSLDGIGNFEASLLWTHTFSLEKKFPDGTTFGYAGTHGPFALSSAGGTPSNRGTFELSWSRDKLALTGRVNFVSSITMIDHEGETLLDNGDGSFSTTTFEGAYLNVDPNGVVCGVYNPDGSVPNGDCELGSFTTFDLSGKYTISPSMEVTGSVQNLFDKAAPFDPYTYGGLNYNPAFHQAGAVGRFMTVGMRVKF